MRFIESSHLSSLCLMLYLFWYILLFSDVTSQLSLPVLQHTVLKIYRVFIHVKCGILLLKKTVFFPVVKVMHDYCRKFKIYIFRSINKKNVFCCFEYAECHCHRTWWKFFSIEKCCEFEDMCIPIPLLTLCLLMSCLAAWNH